MNDKNISTFLEQVRLPAIMLHRPYPPTRFPETNSYLGGLPALPPGFGWPRADDGTPLHFLAQIDCADLPLMESLMPKNGVFFFFALIDEEMSWAGGGDNQRDKTRILFAPVAGHEPATQPFDLPAIQGGHSNRDRYQKVEGDKQFIAYPRWPIVAYEVGAWPDESALDDVPFGYQDAVNRARCAEAVRATGLPTETGLRPRWGKSDYHPKNGLPFDGKSKFPQSWSMIDRVSRYLANWARNCIEKEAARKPEEKAYHFNDLSQLAKIRDDSLDWVAAGSEADWERRPDEERAKRFHVWLSELGKYEDSQVQSAVGVALKFGMNSAIKHAASSSKAARLIPAQFYADSQFEHLPTYQRRDITSGVWSIGGEYHQMLANAGSSQEARGFERDDVLMLKLVSDSGVDFMFCDCGEIEFWISKRDLAEQRFESAWAATCGA